MRGQNLQMFLSNGSYGTGAGIASCSKVKSCIIFSRSVRPQLGAMSGWDEAFDRKFDSAALASGPTSLPGDPYDPFAAPGGGGVSMSGVDAFLPGAPSNTPQAQRRADEDEFGQGVKSN